MNHREPGPRTVLLVSTLHGHIHVLMILFAGVQGLMAEEFGRSHGEMGFLAFWAYSAFGLGAPPAGWLADRFGSHRVLEITALTTSIAAALVSFATTLTMLFLGLLLLGLSASLYHPAGLGLLSRCSNRGRAFAIHGVGGSVGLAVAPALAGTIATLAGDSWRAPYVAASVVSLLLLLGLLATRESATKPADADDAAPLQEDGGIPHFRALVVALLMMTSLGLCYRGSLTFLPEVLGKGLQENLPGYSAVAIGGWIASLALLVGVGGQWIGGTVLFHRFRLEPLFGVLLLPCLAGLAILGLGDRWLLALGAGVFAFFFFAAQPVGNGLVARYTPARLRSTGYGIHFLLTFGFGSMGAWIAGEAYEAWGGGGAFLAMLGPAGLAVLLAGVLVAQQRPGMRGRDPEAGSVPS